MTDRLSPVLSSDPPWLQSLAPLAKARAGSGPAHDYLHVTRVVGLARAIVRAEGGREEVAVASALLHELFNYPKGHPESHRSGEVCAQHAAEALESVRCPSEFIAPIAYAIGVHPFSLGVIPTTLEACILQDADRLDAMGAVGVARLFSTCAEMGSLFYDPLDPFGESGRPLDDKRYGVDHFYRKLLKLTDGLHTSSARAMGARRKAFLEAFLAEMREELLGPLMPPEDHKGSL